MVEAFRKVDEGCLRIDHDGSEDPYTLVDIDRKRVVVWYPEQGRFGLSSLVDGVMEIGEKPIETDLIEFLPHLSEEQVQLVIRFVNGEELEIAEE